MEKRARDKLTELGLMTIQNIGQAVETLSGGQRQGVAVARAAAFGSKVVIMDEPTAALGVKESRRVLELILDVKRRGLPIVNLPGCPVQPDNITETLLELVLHLAGVAPPPELDEQGRPVRLFGRTVHESCDRAGYAEQGAFSKTHGDGRCLVKLGCKGPVVVHQVQHLA